MVARFPQAPDQLLAGNRRSGVLPGLRNETREISRHHNPVRFARGLLVGATALGAK